MSRFTRIILINDRGQGVREFTISHVMVWILGLLALLLAAAVAVVLVTYGAHWRRAATVPGLQSELLAARADLGRVQQLQDELAELRGFQAQLLTMLGVEVGAVDGFEAPDPQDVDDLQRLAAVVMSPSPDLWPTAGFVTAEFAEGAIAQGVRPHPGVDIAGPPGAPILAAGDGVVARVGEDPFLGNFVEIQHGLGYLSVYGHCASVAVARAERVRRGQVIAYLGATGQASAPHLHFEIWHNGTAVDPRLFLFGEPPTP